MIGLHRSYLMVAMAICGVCYFDEQFRADLVAGLKSYAGDSSKWFHIVLGCGAAYSIYLKLTKHMKMEAIKGGVGLRLRINQKLGWVVVEVVPGGSGEEGGVKAADIILAVCACVCGLSVCVCVCVCVVCVCVCVVCV